MQALAGTLVGEVPARFRAGDHRTRCHPLVRPRSRARPCRDRPAGRVRLRRRRPRRRPPRLPHRRQPLRIVETGRDRSGTVFVVSERLEGTTLTDLAGRLGPASVRAVVGGGRCPRGSPPSRRPPRGPRALPRGRDQGRQRGDHRPRLPRGRRRAGRETPRPGGGLPGPLPGGRPRARPPRGFLTTGSVPDSVDEHANAGEVMQARALGRDHPARRARPAAREPAVGQDPAGTAGRSRPGTPCPGTPVPATSDAPPPPPPVDVLLGAAPRRERSGTATGLR